eukprot:6490350-Amphidinium_carterae.1
MKAHIKRSWTRAAVGQILAQTDEFGIVSNLPVLKADIAHMVSAAVKDVDKPERREKAFQHLMPTDMTLTSILDAADSEALFDDRPQKEHDDEVASEREEKSQVLASMVCCQGICRCSRVGIARMEKSVIAEVRGMLPQGSDGMKVSGHTFGVTGASHLAARCGMQEKMMHHIWSTTFHRMEMPLKNAANVPSDGVHECLVGCTTSGSTALRTVCCWKDLAASGRQHQQINIGSVPDVLCWMTRPQIRGLR